MKELQDKIAELKEKSQEIGKILKLEEKKEEIKKLEKESEVQDFWNDHEKASKVMQELEELRKEIREAEALKNSLDSLEEMMKMAESDPAFAKATAGEDRREIEKEIEKIDGDIKKLEFKTLFSEEYDRNDVILSIYSGAGGADAQDWSEMLLKMYLKWAENGNFRAKILDSTRGELAGIKNATLEIAGPFAYGKLKSESGVHRLVRLSPFNSDNLRQTSFALVEILPVIDDVKEVEIKEADIKMDTFRSSGAGGQSVNKTSSAVRLTHIPTGIVVSCQNERSQMQNRVSAMKILRAKIHQKYLEEKEKEKRKLRGEQISAEWGSQIRSYVVHPYKMVKDHRTKHETADVEGVLAGHLDDFQESYLKYLKK
jgi:peptide chain release factor 2